MEHLVLTEFVRLVRNRALEEAKEACGAVNVSCMQCAGQNEHEQCDVAQAEDYIAAIDALKEIKA